MCSDDQVKKTNLVITQTKYIFIMTITIKDLIQSNIEDSQFHLACLSGQIEDLNPDQLNQLSAQIKAIEEQLKSIVVSTFTTGE